ncbi:hypothetical protein [Rothia sp. 88186D007BW]
MAGAYLPATVGAAPSNGRISVEFAELEPLAQQLSAVAGRYEESSHALGGLTARLALLASLDFTGAGARALASLGTSTLTLTTLVSGMHNLARGVRTAAENYQQAEAFANHVIIQAEQAQARGKATVLGIQSAFGYQFDQLKLVVSQAAVTVVSPAKDAFLLARRTPEGRQEIRKFTNGINKLSQIAGANGRLRATRDMTNEINPTQGQSQELPLTTRGIAEHFHRMEGIENRGDELFESANYQGAWDHVMVQTLYNPETGQTQYLITIPGTDGDPERNGLFQLWRGGTNSWAGAAGSAASGYNPDLTPEQYTALMTQVERTLEEAGAPEGSEIILAGFSQGGLTAAALASNTSFGSRYKVKGLLTQASPVDDIKVPDAVIHVDVRYKADPVPYLQGDRDDYAPDVATVLPHRPDDVGFHGAEEYTKIAAANPGTDEVIPELEELMGGYTLADTTIIAGTTQRPGITRTEQEQMALLGVSNATHAGIQKIGGGHRFIHSASINPSELYQDTDSVLRTIDTEIIQKGDRWLDTQLRKVKIGDLQLHNPTPPSFGEKPPAPLLDSSIQVYQPTAKHHARNLTNLAGVGDLISDETIDEGVSVFLPESANSPG